MSPENENGQDPTSGSESAVVVDLTETDLNKQAKPLTDVKSGEGEAPTNQNNDDAATADAGGEDDELEGAPKPWRKRLKREIRQKVQLRADLAATSDEVERLREENASLRRAPSREEAPNTADLDTKISAKQTELENALEAGESKRAAALQVEIGELTGQKATRIAAPRRQQEQPRERERQAQPRKGPTPTGKAFLEANASWWNEPQHAAARAAIVALDNELLRDNSDPDTEAHYAKIAQKAKAMGLKVKIRQPFDEGDEMDTTVDLDERRETRRQTPPQGGNGNIRQAANSELRDARANKVTLKLGANFDGPDAQTMEKFKLDPRNPAHVRAFAKSRQERVLNEAQS